MMCFRQGRRDYPPAGMIMTALAAACCLGATPVRAEDAPAPPEMRGPVKVTFDYKLDAVGVAEGPGSGHALVLGDADLAADVDLEKAVGWRGAAAHVEVSQTHGGAPNERAGTLQGVNNIEVASRRLRLYQAWVEQGWADGALSLRAGAYDVSSEFATLTSAADLIAPAFGIAPELAGGGPNGVAAYPSTALGARLSLQRGHGYAYAAVVNARPGALGDNGGVDTGFSDGVLLIGEAGYKAKSKLAIGYWAFSQLQPGQGPAASGDRRAWGGYLAAETPIHGGWTAFARVGMTDGNTQPLAGSWQAGVRLQPLLHARPDSLLALGVSQVRLASAYRAAEIAAGLDPSQSETLVELTYADIVGGKLRLQPDLQYVRFPGGDRRASDAVVASMRLELTL